jgi:hypothetical protein
MKYYIVTQDGHAITEKLTMKQIVEQFGSVQELEAAGCRVVLCTEGTKGSVVEA